MAVAHAEGKAEFDSSEQLNGLYDKNQVALQYVDSHHQVTERYPYNPNGAPKGIAGVLANEGKTLIMMPHPERACSDDLANADGRAILQGLAEQVLA